MLELSVAERRYVFPDEYIPRDDGFFTMVSGAAPPSWRVILEAPWYHCIPYQQSLPVQGWKIHLSASPSDAGEVLKRAALVCFEMDAPFKFACDKYMAEWMNSKNQNRGSAGKFLTVYPTDTDHLRKLLDRLKSATDGLHGPFVLSDRRYKDSSVLYYRYGGIRSLAITDVLGDAIPYLVRPDGQLVPDERLPRFVSRPWAPDPVAPFVGPQLHAGPRHLLHSRYEVLGAVQFSNAGGVYRARDQRTGDLVAIKEARPFVAMGGAAEDALSRLRRAWDVAQALADTGYVARPVEYFRQWEHEFLAVQWVEGTPLDAVPAVRHPIAQLETATPRALAEYYAAVRQVVLTIGGALQEVQRSGWRLGDLSPSNILLQADGLPLFVDLESAVDPRQPTGRRMATPGFDRPSAVPDEGFALANLLLWLCGFQPQFAALDPQAARAWLVGVASRIDIPDAMVSALEALCFGAETVGLDHALLVLSAADSPIVRRPSYRGADPGEGAASAIAGLLDSLDYSSRRLIPAHFQPGHPLSVAHGALGVMYAVQRTGGSPPPPLRDWVLRRLDSATTARVPPGLYTGLAGMAWVLADGGYVDDACDLIERAWRHELLFASPDVFYGVAGVGLSLLHLWRVTGQEPMRTKAAALGTWLLSTGQREGSVICWRREGEKAARVGYARGASGIALFLLYAGIACRRPDFVAAAEAGLSHDLQCAIRGPEAISFPEDAGDTRLREPYWYAGTAGVGTALVRFVHAGYARAWRGHLPLMIQDTRRVLTANPGLFSGLAGLGNFLLDCEQYIDEKSLLCAAAAEECARSLMALGMTSPAGTRYPGDLMHKESGDFGTGTAGIALFLHRVATGADNFNFIPDEILDDAQRFV